MRYEMLDNYTGEKARLSTVVEAKFEDNKLYVSFFAETDSHTPRHTKYNAPLWEGDIVEVLMTLGKPNHYLEIEVNEVGARYAVVITNLDGKGDILIQPLPDEYFTAEVKTEGDIWRTDAVIFLDKLVPLEYNDSEVKINYLRQNFAGEKLELYAVSPTMCGKFHITSAFFDANKGETK